MNLVKYTITPPIPSTITSMELDVASIVGWKPTLDNNSSYEWKMYPKTVLFDFMNEKRIGALTRILVDHTAEELFDYFSTMTRNLFNDSTIGGVAGMGPSNIPTGVMTSNIPENAPPGSHVGSFVGRIATGGIFGKAEEEQFEDRRGPRGQDAGQVYVGRNSMLAQMQDPLGKNKTQQVIMVENMLGNLDEILESYRAREKREDRIEERMETLVDRAHRLSLPRPMCTLSNVNYCLQPLGTASVSSQITCATDNWLFMFSLHYQIFVRTRMVRRTRPVSAGVSWCSHGQKI